MLDLEAQAGGLGHLQSVDYYNREESFPKYRDQQSLRMLTFHSCPYSNLKIRRFSPIPVNRPALGKPDSLRSRSI